MPDKLTNIDFSPNLNQTFRIRLDGVESIDLELVNVTEAGSASRPDARQTFSLDFLGFVSPQYLPQHIDRVEHEEMGALDLFLVPLGQESGHMRHDAIFT